MKPNINIVIEMNMLTLNVLRLIVQGPCVEVIGNNKKLNNPPIKSTQPNINFFIY